MEEVSFTGGHQGVRGAAWVSAKARRLESELGQQLLGRSG
jgi:hypothetical protein